MYQVQWYHSTVHWNWYSSTGIIVLSELKKTLFEWWTEPEKDEKE
jgi:hypothetical protein